MSSPKHPQTAKRIVAAGFLWFMLMGAAVTMTGPISVALAQQFGRPAADESLLGTAFFAGGAAFIITNTLFSAFFVGAWVARLCACLYLGGTLLAFTSQSWLGLLIGASLIGAGNGGFSIWFNAEVAKAFEGPKVGAWLTALNGCWAVGAVLGPYLVRLAPLSPQQPYFWLALSACLVLPLTLSIPGRRASPNSAETMPQTMPRRVYGLSILLGLYVGAETAILLLMTRHLLDVHKIPFETATLINSGLWLAFLIARFGAGPISMRVHSASLIGVAALLCAGGLLLATQSATAVIGYAIVGLAMGPIFPAVIAWGTGICDAPHRATSIMVFGACIASFTIPRVVAHFTVNQMALLPIIAMGMQLAIAALAFVWRPRLDLTPAPEPE